MCDDSYDFYSTTTFCGDLRPSVGPNRPFTHMKLLNLGDIKPGLRVQRWYEGKEQGVETIASNPFYSHQSTENSSRGNEQWVTVESPHRDSLLNTRSLADMGVVPYCHNGMWNQFWCATKAEDLEPIQVWVSGGTIDFYLALYERMGSIDAEGSDYKMEPVVSVLVPEHLRAAIHEHETVYRSKTGGYIHRERDVTVKFVHA